MQQVIRDDGVEHAHAAFVEHPHDQLGMADFRRQPAGCHAGFLGHDEVGLDMVYQMIDLPVGQPDAQSTLEKRIGKILAPERRVVDAGLGERAVQIEHSHEARPLPGPVRDRQDRPFVVDEARQHMMGILPGRLRDDDRRIRRQIPERIEPHALRRKEAVPAFGVVMMCPDNLRAKLRHGARQRLLHGLLRRPADAIRTLAQITARQQIYAVHPRPL